MVIFGGFGELKIAGFSETKKAPEPVSLITQFDQSEMGNGNMRGLVTKLQPSINLDFFELKKIHQILKQPLANSEI